MNDQEFENYIKKMFASLPRQSVPAGDKQAVWLRLQNFLRDSRQKNEAFRRTHAGFWAAWRLSRTVAAVLVIVLSLSIAGGVARAAKGSLPGDSLYPVKKAVEVVEVAIASAQGQKQKIQTLKVHAQTRLLEVTTLVEENKVSAPVVQKTLEDLEKATSKVVAVSEVSPELKSHAVELAREEEQVLADVETRVEGEVKESVQKALTASRESIDKLEASEEEVKGSVAEEDQPASAAASSTPTSTPAGAVKKSAPAKPKDGIITSPAFLDGPAIQF